MTFKGSIHTRTRFGARFSMWFMIWDMFFVVRSNDSFNFPLGLIKYVVIVKSDHYFLLRINTVLLYCVALQSVVLYCTVLYCTGLFMTRQWHAASDWQTGHGAPSVTTIPVTDTARQHHQWRSYHDWFGQTWTDTQWRRLIWIAYT